MSFSYVLADQHSLQSAFHTCKLSPPSHQHIHVCALIPYRVFVGGGLLAEDLKDVSTQVLKATFWN